MEATDAEGAFPFSSTTFATETDAVERKPLHGASSKHPPGVHGEKKVLGAVAVWLHLSCFLFLSCHQVYCFSLVNPLQLILL